MKVPDAGSQEYAAIVQAAARLYLPAGLYPFFFARGKLSGDPVFAALLSRGLIPDGARILDLGCGQGLLGALLIAAQAQFESGIWPARWPAPPRQWSMAGIELRDSLAHRGRVALGSRIRVDTGDVRTAGLPQADIVVVLDVLHYLDAAEQQQVLEKITRNLQGGGMLLLRVGDAAAGLRFQITRWVDCLAASLRYRGGSAHHYRAAKAWSTARNQMGFQVDSEPMSQGTPFANVLLIARRLPKMADPVLSATCQEIQS